MTIENQLVGMVGSVGSDGCEQSKPWFYRSILKRPLDIMLVVLSAPIVIPVVFILALLVWRDGGNPFYSQMRVGKNGRLYRMWKLRSMVVDADARLSAYLAKNPAAKEEWDRKQKLLDDPRVTPFGHFLRRSSLDELPQLWNVLVGSMSIVGPRPMMPNQTDLYSGEGYFSLRPGITGFWQTAGRNSTTFAARAFYDDTYERDLSFTSDASIIYKTFGVVFRATGQ